MRVALLTLGCRVNQSESSVIEGTLEANGVTIVNINDNPDYCVVNTCSVTQKSDYNSRQMIRRGVKNGAKVIVTGCYSQLRPDEISSIQGVTEIVDSRKKYEIINRILDRPLAPFFGRSSHSRPNLKVQDGCNFACSYCSVPIARGRSTSTPVEEVIRRAKELVDGGYQEIVITGVHLGIYGKDLAPVSGLAELIKGILLKTKIHRLRLSSIEIGEVSDEMLELMQEDRLCKHLHLPLQSGSNSVLRAMRRNYTIESFSRSLRKIHSRIGNISIGTDIIIGFPGEGEKEAHKTMEMLEESPFSYMHIFPFSARPGTEAYRFKDRPSPGTVKSRMEKLLELSSRKKERFLNEQLDTILEAVVEDKISEDSFSGTSGNFVKVLVCGKGIVKGSVVRVRPEKVSNNQIEGSLIKSL
jgi:threonylcarbamoyladenosine tRNA methylthiotransferase MtaB